MSASALIRISCFLLSGSVICAQNCGDEGGAVDISGFLGEDGGGARLSAEFCASSDAWVIDCIWLSRGSALSLSVVLDFLDESSEGE